MDVARLRLAPRRRRSQPPTKRHPTQEPGFAERWYATVNAIRERRISQAVGPAIRAQQMHVVRSVQWHT
jgi:hypothetical protein